jgi:hypothetical protein
MTYRFFIAWCVFFHVAKPISTTTFRVCASTAVSSLLLLAALQPNVLSGHRKRCPERHRKKRNRSEKKNKFLLLILLGIFNGARMVFNGDSWDIKQQWVLLQ